jgi:hypothetical protein
MKNLIFIFLTLCTLTAKAQTADVNTTENNNETRTTDLMISIPMIGNINIKNCDEKMQEELKFITDIKVIKIDDAIYFYMDKEERILAAHIQEEKEIDLPLQ